MKSQQDPLSTSTPLSDPEKELLDAVHPASFMRRLGALAYDSLMVFSVVFISVQWLLFVPEEARNSLLVITGIRITAIVTSFLFLGWFWTHSGQTVGMKAWRLRVVTEDGRPITWAQAIMRYIVSIISWLAAGLGYIWSIFDKDKRSWHDIASNTRLVVLPKQVE